MSDGYRDPLAAAHARIAELEEKVATLEAESATKQLTAAGRFPELERKVEALRLRSDERFTAKQRLWLTWIGIAFPLLSAVFSYLHLPIYAAAASIVFTAVIVLNLRHQSVLKANRRLLADAEKELADAHRIAELESKLAAKEQENVRVAAAPEPEPLSASDSDEAAGRRLRS